MLIDTDLIQVVRVDVINVHVLRVIWLLMLLHSKLLPAGPVDILLHLLERFLSLAALDPGRVRHDAFGLGDGLKSDS